MATIIRSQNYVFGSDKTTLILEPLASIGEERGGIFYICNEFTVKIFDERPAPGECKGHGC